MTHLEPPFFRSANQAFVWRAGGVRLQKRLTTRARSVLNRTVRFLVIEDDSKIAGFILDGLSREGHEVAVAGDGEAALRHVGQSPVPFDALVLDLMLPRLNGFDVLRSLRAGGIRSPVLMLSALDSVDDRVRGLRAGADDYLVKPFAFDELTARLLALTRRTHPADETPSKQAVLALADLSMDRLNRQVRRGPRAIELQPKEFALLECFLVNAGRPLTRAMILEAVWHWTFDPQTNVVDVLVRRLRGKIDLDSEPKLIHTLRGIGYVLRAD